MKSKLLHEHSMAEYLYTNPELLDENWLTDKAKEVGHSVADMAQVYGLDPRPAIGVAKSAVEKTADDYRDDVMWDETADDVADEIEQILPWISDVRKNAKLIEKDNDEMIRALRDDPKSIWGEILRGADKKDFDIKAFLDDYGIVEDADWFMKTAIALMAMNKRNWKVVASTLTNWFKDLSGGGHSEASRAIGIGIAAAGMAAGSTILGVGLGVIGIFGVASSFIGGEEKAILSYIRNTLGDHELADCLEKGSEKDVIEETSATAIQLMFWKYENYFLKIIGGTQDFDPSAVQTFDEWYDKQYRGEGRCKSKNQRGNK